MVSTGEKAPRLMIVSDLDNTMVDHQDPAHSSLLRFNDIWKSDFAHDSLLVFSTGRSPTLYKELREHVPLLTPGILIMSVGTEIVYGDSLTPDSGWESFLNEGWNRETIVTAAKSIPNLTFQAESEQRPHKVSFSVAKDVAPQIIQTLSSKLQEAGLRVKFIYSGGSDLDILPQEAGKGGALAYLLKKFTNEGRRPTDVLACGDSGNDAELFEVEGANGVIVGNAMDELVQWYEKQSSKDHVFRATKRCASGIVQAIEHFHFLQATSN